ncbi:hypothetical protein C7I87_00760 [Mesorhizobium sp. SARCC-RB16n]|uniref:hypothetical protein n=1 Tax=Mesorhizobium sp. SARCC-RB16n TaxID=2116687 RepID=UPI00122EB252|nr:hypothetical protein [Mesorhizobium sp. SARCC-RB16n]KAA3452743.1 hypothetical protein C7I87_00760 [Mesorhizobium sp. SARCC-RB16n]
MHVYRIEHPNHPDEGPWQTGAVYRYDANRREDACSAYDHPGPRCSGEAGTALSHIFRQDRSARESYVFGFRSKTQLVLWFSSKAGRQAMQEAGTATLRVYEVAPEHVAKGNRQVAFKRDAARPVATLNLATFKPAGEC